MISSLSIADLEKVRDEAHARGDCMTAGKAQECIIRKAITTAVLLRAGPTWAGGPDAQCLRIIVSAEQATALTHWIEQALGIKIDVRTAS